jgi:hypothetical protein
MSSKRMDVKTLEEWEALSGPERESLIATWDIYSETGYWENLFKQAVDELRQKLRANSNVTRVFRANHHGRLEICIATVRGAPSLPGFDNFRTMYRGLPVRQISA